MPPAPMAAVISYGPRRSPGLRNIGQTEWGRTSVPGCLAILPEIRTCSIEARDRGGAFRVARIAAARGVGHRREHDPLVASDGTTVGRGHGVAHGFESLADKLKQLRF